MTLRFFILTISLLMGALNLSAQEFKVYKFSELEPQLHLNNDTTYVVNFWAMWCKPCVEELPYLEQAHLKYKNEKVKFLLVSLDFGKNRQKQLQNFLKKKNITAQVVILDDPNSNSWITRVDSLWDGALPGTLLYRGKRSLFINKQISYEEVEDAINTLRE